MEAKELYKSFEGLEFLTPLDKIRVSLIVLDLVPKLKNENLTYLRNSVLGLNPKKDKIILKDFKNEPFILEIDKKSRKPKEVIKRFFVFWWIRQKGFTLSECAFVFDKKHETALHGIRAIDTAILIKDRYVLEICEEMKEKLRINGYELNI